MFFKKSNGVVCIRLVTGEAFFPSVKKALVELNVRQAAIVSCVGMLREVELGTNYAKGKGYDLLRFPGPLELVSVQGNVAYAGEELIIHAHVALGKEDGGVVGGHLLNALANVSCELFLLEVDLRLRREFEEETGLKGLYLG